MPDETTFQGYMKMLGIGSDHHVIVYDNMKLMTAPRVWWTLRVFGHERVSLLNGPGRKNGHAEDRPLTTDALKFRRPRSGLFQFLHDPLSRRCLGQSKEPVTNKFSMRAVPGALTGLTRNRGPNAGPGHIPGSQNCRSTS